MFQIIENVDSVCWECLFLFHKVYKFKQRVLQAQACLKSARKKVPTYYDFHTPTPCNTVVPTMRYNVCKPCYQVSYLETYGRPTVSTGGRLPTLRH